MNLNKKLFILNVLYIIFIFICINLIIPLIDSLFFPTKEIFVNSLNQKKILEYDIPYEHPKIITKIKTNRLFGDDGGYIYLYSGPFLIKKTRADDIDNEIYKYVMEHGYDTGIICILDVLILLMIILAIKNSKNKLKQ